MEWVRPAGRGDVHVLMTDRSHGDLRIDAPAPELASRRSSIVDRPWSWLRQVHGAGVVVVGDEPALGTQADALVTETPGAVLAIHTADCGPVALVSREGPVAAVHAGWRGVQAGVLPAAVEALESLGGREVVAWLGPCIHSGAYEFGPADLDVLAGRFGDEVRAVTDTGSAALDLPAAIRASLAEAGVPLVEVAPVCTATDERYFSHRARSEPERQALVVWIDP